MYLTNKYNLSISRNLMTGWLLFYYSFSHKKAQRQAALFDIYPSPQMTTMYWNIPDSKFIRKSLSLSFPKIQCNQMIFVPKLSKHILDDSIQDLNMCIPEERALILYTRTESVFPSEYYPNFLCQIYPPHLLQILHHINVKTY